MSQRSYLQIFTTLACACLAACIGPEPKPSGSTPSPSYGAGTGGSSRAGSGAKPAGSGGSHAGVGGEDPDDPATGGSGGDGEAGRPSTHGGAGAGGSAGKKPPPPPAAGAAGEPTAGHGGGGSGGSMSEFQCEPCSTSADCASGETCMGLWCSSTCSSDIACGTSPKGAPNHCLTNYKDDHICFPGCKVNTDCSLYPGTTCQETSDGDTVCSRTSASGYPCKTSTDCDNKLTCLGALWCTPNSCSADSECGTSPTGQSNYCVKNTGGNNYCFPGCSSNDDCKYFSDTTCRKLSDGRGSACMTTSAGTPCSNDTDCGTSYVCTGTDGWCTLTGCDTDTDCGTGPNGRQSKCLENNGNVNSCFPGCITDSDCAPYPGTTCATSFGACARASSN